MSSREYMMDVAKFSFQYLNGKKNIRKLYEAGARALKEEDLISVREISNKMYDELFKQHTRLIECKRLVEENREQFESQEHYEKTLRKIEEHKRGETKEMKKLSLTFQWDLWHNYHGGKKR